MGLLRRRLSRPASLSSNNNRNGGRGFGGGRRNKRAGGVNPFLKLVSILCIYLIGAVYTVSKRPDLRSQLNAKFQSVLQGEQTIFEFLSELSPRNMKKKMKKKTVNGDDSSSSQQQQQQQQQQQKKSRIRIPCGLIIAAAADVAVDNENKEVLPLTTCIELLEVFDDNNENNNGKSFLNEKIFQRYPQFEKYVVNDNSIMPSGIFQLRMGSIDATIEVSPELHIIKQHTSSSSSSSDDDDDCDLILGKQFWDNHFTEFNDDELYVSTTTTTLSETKSETASTTTTPTRSRVMVPYIRIRQSLSFDNSNDNDNDSSDL
jgi:hypothetical protein